MSELCTEGQAQAAARAACLAHLDATIRRMPGASDYLDHRLARELELRGVELEIAM
jgi:hypothetical protein